jgi:hypothetical protein
MLVTRHNFIPIFARPGRTTFRSPGLLRRGGPVATLASSPVRRDEAHRSGRPPISCGVEGVELEASVLVATTGAPPTLTWRGRQRGTAPSPGISRFDPVDVRAVCAIPHPSPRSAAARKRRSSALPAASRVWNQRDQAIKVSAAFQTRSVVAEESRRTKPSRSSPR